MQVIEFTRAARKGRRHLGKNDTRDAEVAALAVVAEEATATPKARDGIVESIRVLRQTRAGAVKVRTQAALHWKPIVTAPDELAEPLSHLTIKQAVRAARSSAPAPPRRQSSRRHTKALRCLARRWQLNDEIREFEAPTRWTRTFFATLKKELVHRRSWPTRHEWPSEVFEYIEAFYNRQRRHSTRGYLSPADYENTTRSPSSTSLAASRLASPNQEIKD